MGYPLKDILKSLKVLYISKNENISSKDTNILKLFFNKIIISYSAEKAIKQFTSEHPDVLIVDINLPKTNGIEFCKKIRKINYSVPIILLSENKNENFLLEAIRIQVIDFVLRPIKIDNIIFALNQTAKHIVNNGNITIKLSNGYIYNYQEKTILSINNKSLKLTKNEFRLLELFLTNKHKTITKKEIENFLWTGENVTDSAFKSLYSRLQAKIGKESIKNSFGVGYQLA